MTKGLGIVSRFPEHLHAFSWSYYEVKDVAGVWHAPRLGSISMISVFGDNRVAGAHPHWVQVGPGGMLGTRVNRYFDWDTLCPSHPEVFELALNWVKQAMEKSPDRHLRLDDATFAREEFCQCERCIAAARERGLSWYEYRIDRITEFVEMVRSTVDHLEMTLFPDPFPGHLERRFGIDVDRLAPFVDRFIVPIYDMHYATTYWLEVLAQGFRERLPRPYAIELYGLKVPERALLHAVEVAEAYCDGVIVAYDNQLEKLLRIQEQLGSV